MILINPTIFGFLLPLFGFVLIHHDVIIPVLTSFLDLFVLSFELQLLFNFS
jgi:hypothetical protein